MLVILSVVEGRKRGEIAQIGASFARTTEAELKDGGHRQEIRIRHSSPELIS
jgi:hypothetical protein